MKEVGFIEQASGRRIQEATKDTAQSKVISRAESWGWLPALSLSSASGLLVLALANVVAYVEFDRAIGLMYVGLLILFVPTAVRLLSATPSRRERIGLVILLGLAMYFVRILRSPILYTGFDELLHWRTAYDIIQSGRLFHANSLLPISPLYPGLEIVTSAVIGMTGLPIFEAGLVVIGVTRLLLVLALYLFFEEISDSPRVGGIAALLYTTNPGFIFFDAQFGYESLALALGVFGMFLIARRLKRHVVHLGSTLAILLVLGAIVVTHHLTSFAFAAFLILLTITQFFIKQPAADRARLGWIVTFDLAAILAWLILVAPAVVDYLRPYTVGAVTQIIRLILNEVTARTLFTDYAGQGTPIWERAVSLASIALILAGLPWGLVHIWRHYGGNSIKQARGAVSSTYTQIIEYARGGSVIALALGVASLAYGLGLPLRLLPLVADVSARSAAFLFIAIAFVLAIGPVQHWLFRATTLKRIVAVALWATILFLGGFILGAGPTWSRLPGPYLISADARSIEPEGIAAANWARNYLGSGNRIASDRINGLLMGSFGLQRPVTHISDKVDISPLYTLPDFGKDAQAVLLRGNIRYIIVDRRLSTGLPRYGVYFEGGEVDAFRHKTPLDPTALAKFDQIKNVSRVFDSGDIVIYDMGAWNDQPQF